MRADVVLARTAVAHAAWRGAEAVDASDVRVAARLALPHRRRRDPFDEPHLGEDELDEAMQKADEAADESEPPPEGGGSSDDSGGPTTAGRTTAAPTATVPTTTAGAPAADPGAARRRRPTGRRNRRRHRRTGAPSGDAAGAAASPRRSPPVCPVGAPASDAAAGAPVRGARHGRGRAGAALAGAGQAGSRGAGACPTPATTRTLHVPATVLAAAGRGAGRWSARDRPAPRGARGPRGQPRALLRRRLGLDGRAQADERGDRGRRRPAARRLPAPRPGRRGDLPGAAPPTVALPPTTSVHAAHARLHDLRTGGRTPLAEGLRTARAVLRTERTRDARRRGLLVVLTDGRATASGGLDAALRGGPGARARRRAPAGGARA